MLASATIPGVFGPVPIGERWLIERAYADSSQYLDRLSRHQTTDDAPWPAERLVPHAHPTADPNPLPVARRPSTAKPITTPHKEH
jgi:predicted acylesterase/phospholipase RssA